MSSATSQLHSWFCCEPPRSSHGLCRKCSEVSYSISSPGLYPSLYFCCQGPALTGIKEGQLNLRSKRDVLVPPYDLQSRKGCCCLGYPGKNLGFWSLVRDDCPKVLEVFSTSSNLWPFILSLFGSHLGCLLSLLSCLDRSPFCTLWWFYQDGLSGCQPLLPLLHLRQCHLQSGSWWWVFPRYWHYFHGHLIVSVPDHCLSFYFTHDSV